MTVRTTRLLHATSVIALFALLQISPVADAAPSQTPEHDGRRLLVGFRPGTSASTRVALHAWAGARLEHRMAWLNLDVIRLPRWLAPETAEALYEKRTSVAYAEPNYRLGVQRIPSDPRFVDEWGLHNTGQRVDGVSGIVDADVDAPEGWDLAFGDGAIPASGGVRVGVLDTGIDAAHVDLRGKTKACAQALTGAGTVVELGSSACADDHGHGTHVAGTIAAITDNGVGVAGVAPNAELSVFKALNALGIGWLADVVAGVHWLRTAGSARIVNMSLGTHTSSESFDAELSAAYAGGTLLIAAAGNSGCTSAAQCVSYPAYHPDVVSVAATDPRDAPAGFSNCNTDVEVAAPGVSVWSTSLAGTYKALSGTSMAAPHASGVAALTMWVKRTNHGETRAILRSSVDDVHAPGRDSCTGYGRVNLRAALTPSAP